MTDIERLIFLNSILKYDGMALGDAGYPGDPDFGLIPSIEFKKLWYERVVLLRKLAGFPVACEHKRWLFIVGTKYQECDRCGMIREVE